ncbi:MAG: PEP/pyruvate-binding domain-containing protein, partial [Candidatus Omnitrophota bacterium]
GRYFGNFLAALPEMSRRNTRAAIDAYVEGIYDGADVQPDLFAFPVAGDTSGEDITDIGTVGTHNMDYRDGNTRARIEHDMVADKYTRVSFANGQFNVASKGANASDVDTKLMTRLLGLTGSKKVQDFLQKIASDNKDMPLDIAIYLLEPSDSTYYEQHPHLLTVKGKQFELATSGTNQGTEQAIYMTRDAFTDLNQRLIVDVLINQIALAVARYKAWHGEKAGFPFGDTNSRKVAHILTRVRAEEAVKQDLRTTARYDMKRNLDCAIDLRISEEVVNLLKTISEAMPRFAPAVSNYQRIAMFHEAMTEYDYDSAIKWWGLVTDEFEELIDQHSPDSERLLAMQEAWEFQELAKAINEKFNKYILTYGIYNQQGEEAGKVVGRVRIIEDVDKIDDEFDNAKGDEIWVIPYMAARRSSIPGRGCIVSVAGNRHAIDTAKEQGIPLAVIPNATALLKDFDGKQGMLRVEPDRDVRFRQAFEGETGLPSGKKKVREIRVPKAKVGDTRIFILGNVDHNFVQFVGPKAASEGTMAQAGIDVPEGLVLAFSFWDKFSKHNGLEENIKSIREKIKMSPEGKLITQGEELRAVLQEMKDLIVAGEFPEDLKKELFDYINPLRSKYGHVGFYIRSSFNFEDLTEKTMAGHYDSYPDEGLLDTSSDENILEGIKMVFASMWNELAFTARVDNKIEDKDVMPGVIIQVPVKAKFAGTMYSANPVSGNFNEVNMMASHGQGAAVVGGAGKPAEVLVNKVTGEIKTLQRTSYVDTKQEIVDGSVSVEYVTTEERDSEIFSPEVVAKLKDIAENVESLYMFRPQDIEWCYAADGRVWIVQSRPMKLDKMPAEKMLDDAMLDYKELIDESVLLSLMKARNDMDIDTLVTALHLDLNLRDLHANKEAAAERMIASEYLDSIANSAEGVGKVNVTHVQNIVNMLELEDITIADPSYSCSLISFVRKVGLASADSQITDTAKEFILYLGT